MLKENLSLHLDVKDTFKGMGKYFASIVLLKIVLAVYVFSKGALDSYLAIVLPMLFISMILIIVTAMWKADFVFTFIAIILFDIGTTMQVMVYPSSTRYMLLQFAALVLGGFVFCVIVVAQNKISVKHQWKVCMTIIVLLYLFLLVFGANINGTKAWINVAGTTFQVTEVIKVVTFCALAAIFASDYTDKKKMVYALSLIFVNGIFLALIKELGTLVVLTLIFLIFVFMFIEPIKYFAITVITMFTMVVGGVGSVFFLSRFNNEGVKDFVLVEIGAAIWGKLKNRILLLTAIDTLDPYGSAYQALTAQKAIRLGGLFGSNYQLSIPVEESDYVFVSLILNMGIILAILVVILFLCLLLSGIRIYTNSEKKLEQCTAAGFIYAMFLQSLLTMLGSTNAFLLMGLPIAFLSAGGSNQMMLFTMLFYILYCGRTVKQYTERRGPVCRINK